MRISDGSSDVCSSDLVHVEDPVAVVGFHAFAPDRLRAGGGHDRARDQAASHRDDLDWQRELAQYIDLLARIDDADELVAGLGNDLLARERRAAALDQALARVTLVGAVDVEREAAGVVELDHFDAVAAQACGALFGTRNRSLDPVPDARRGGEERWRRGA